MPGPRTQPVPSCTMFRVSSDQHTCPWVEVGYVWLSKLPHRLTMGSAPSTRPSSRAMSPVFTRVRGITRPSDREGNGGAQVTVCLLEGRPSAATEVGGGWQGLKDVPDSQPTLLTPSISEAEVPHEEGGRPAETPDRFPPILTVCKTLISFQELF